MLPSSDCPAHAGETPLRTGQIQIVLSIIDLGDVKYQILSHCMTGQRKKEYFRLEISEKPLKLCQLEQVTMIHSLASQYTI